MSSFHRINVSRDGQFYFRADNEHISKQGAETMVREFRLRFPESDGFKVSLIYWACAGHNVEVA